MSSVLAFVMLFSSLVMVNVVSVSADTDRVLDFGAEDVYAKWGSTTSIASKTYTYEDIESIADFSVYINGKRSDFKKDAGDTQGYVTFGKGDYINFRSKTDGAVLKVDVSTSKDSKARHLDVTGVDAVTGTGAAIPSTKAKEYDTANPMKFTLGKAGQYKIMADGDSVTFYSVTVTEKDGGSSGPTEITWEVQDNTSLGLSGNLSVVQTKDASYTILRYTGNDYSVIPSKRIIETETAESEGDVTHDGNTYTLTLTDDNWDKYLTKDINIPVENIKISGGGNRGLHLTCVPHNTVYTIKLENGQAYALIKEGENGGYVIPDKADAYIPLHNGTLTASMVGGQLEKDGSVANTIDFKIDDVNSKIEATFKPYTIENVSDSVTKTEFNQYKVSSVVRGERLFGGTVLDPEGKHFFVAAAKDKETDGVYTLTDPVALGTDTDMKAVVLRAPGTSTADGTVPEGEGIGFILDDLKGEDIGKDITYTLNVYCTSVQDIKEDQEAKETSIAIHEIDKENYSAIASGYTKNDSVPVQDTDVVLSPSDQPIKFSNLKPGKAYAVYNPKGESGEPQGNIRVYAMELVKDENTASEDTLVWTADNPSGSDILGDAFKTKTPTSTSNPSRTGTFAKNIFADGTNTIRNHDYVTFNSEDVFIPSQSGTLTLWLTHSSGGNDKATIKDITNEDAVVYSGGFSDRDAQDIPAVVINNVVAGHQYRPSANGWLFKAELTPSGPIVTTPTISGKVTQAGGFEDKTGYTTDTYFTGSAEGSITQNIDIKDTSVDPIGLKGAKVVIKGTDEGTNIVNKEITIENEDGSFSYTGEGDANLPAGAYSVTASNNGKAIGSAQTVTVSEDGTVEPASLSFNTDNRVEVTFKTNIKDYKGEIIVSQNGAEKFRIIDTTYHYNSSKKPADAVNDIARVASVTSKVKMPVGVYDLTLSASIKKDDHNDTNLSDRYNVSTESSSVNGKLNITAGGTKQLYLIPIESKTDTDVKAAAQANASTLDFADAGVYTFTPPEAESTASAAKAAISKDGADAGNKMIAMGTKGPKDHATQFDVHGSGSYVIFKTDKKHVAKITVSSQSYILANLDGGNTISGKDKIVIDSRYGNINVTLDEGTYILYSTSASDGYVTEIRLTNDSPFIVRRAVDANGTDITGSAKMLIGIFDASADYSEYTTFAIMVSENKNALADSAINNGSNDPKDGTADETVKSTDEYTPKVFILKAHYNPDVPDDAANVAIDTTETLFKKVVDANGTSVADSEDNFYYATIVDQLAPGTTYYATGAAKMSGDDTGWMLQDGGPISFSVTE